MRLVLPTQKEPLTVTGPQLFTDWRHVNEGAIDWMRDGKNVKTWDPTVPPATPVADFPYGVRLEGQRGEVVGPLFEMDRPWERGYLMYVNSILFWEGKYRLWYTMVPDDYRNADVQWHVDIGWVLCYAESDDGFNWVKPEIGLTTWEGQKTNWVYGRQLSPNAFASGAPFIDPHAPEEERFKLLYRSEEKRPDMNAFIERQRQRFGDDIDPKAIGGKPGQFGTCAPTSGAVSADGIHWKPIDDPIMMYCSDQMNTAMWDGNIEKYVGYFRMLRGGNRRSVGRSETADFRKWPTPTPCLEIPLDWKPSDDIMHCPVVAYPGTSPTVYVMQSTLFHRDSDCRDIQLATSADGRYWQWLPGGPSVPANPQGPTRKGNFSFDYQELECGYGIVPLSGDRIGMPAVAYEFPYKHPRWNGSTLGAPAYVTWKTDRIGALVADEQGEFATFKIKVPARELSLNMAGIGAAGGINVELRDAKNKPIPGHTFAESDLIAGDCIDKRVTWQGTADMSALVGEVVSLRVRLRRARLFAFEFKS